MARYLLSERMAQGQTNPSMTEEEMRRGIEVIGALEADMQKAKALVFSGRLTEPSSATLVDATNGPVMTTDGPFVEAKESIGGFYIIDAADLDAATDWAARTSTAVGMPIEVRPFFDSRGG